MQLGPWRLWTRPTLGVLTGVGARGATCSLLQPLPGWACWGSSCWGARMDMGPHWLTCRAGLKKLLPWALRRTRGPWGPGGVELGWVPAALTFSLHESSGEGPEHSGIPGPAPSLPSQVTAGACLVFCPQVHSPCKVGISRDFQEPWSKIRPGDEQAASLALPTRLCGRAGSPAWSSPSRPESQRALGI